MSVSRGHVMNQKLLKRWYLALGCILPFSAGLLVAWLHMHPNVLFEIKFPLWITIGIGVAFVAFLPWYARFLKEITETRLEFWGWLTIDVVLVIMILTGLLLL